MPPFRKDYYTVLLDRSLGGGFLLFTFLLIFLRLLAHYHGPRFRVYMV